MLDEIDRVLVNERSHYGLAIKWIPDCQGFVSSQKLTSNLGCDRFVHDHAPRGCATLSRRAYGAEKDRLSSHVGVGTRRDNQRVVAAKFHDRFPQAAMNSFRNIKPHRYRSCR